MLQEIERKQKGEVKRILDNPMRKCVILERRKKSLGLVNVRKEGERKDGALWEPAGQELKDGYSLLKDTPSPLSLSLFLTHSLTHCFPH